MTPPNTPQPMSMPCAEEMTTRMVALMALREQMLELHARLEYLRLLLRVSGPSLPLH